MTDVDGVNTDLAIRAARAEIERDAALERAKRAEEAVRAFTMKDEDAILDTLHVMGIPARDLRDIYKVVTEWRRNGGRQGHLELYRELFELRNSRSGEA